MEPPFSSGDRVEGEVGFSGRLSAEFFPGHGEAPAPRPRKYFNEYWPIRGEGPKPVLTRRHRVKLWWGSKKTQWKLDHGLIQRGRDPDFIPKPKGFLAKVYLKVTK
jgi:hypothetical protein